MNFNCSEQLAGFGKISLYLLEETGNWPLVLTDQNSAQIDLQPYDVDIEGVIEPDSISISDKPKLSDEGNMWPIDIQFSYLSRGEAMEQLLEQYANRPCIVVACTNYGPQKLYGSNQEPLYMNWENNNGEKIEDRAGVNIRIKGDARQRPVFYNLQ